MATALTQTTLSAAATATATVINVASATGISAPTNSLMQSLYIVNPNQTKGELVNVTAVSGTQISIARNSLFRQAFASGAIVIIGSTNNTLQSFQEYDPNGTVSASAVQVTPWINATNGNQWLYSSVQGSWVPGFNNPSTQKGVSEAVASANGLITPSGPLFHVTGTNAITGFTIPVGYAGGPIQIIPDGVFTWTNANNIAVAGTAVVSKLLTFVYDPGTAKFYPSYVA